MPAVRLSRYEYAAVHRDPEGRTYLDVPHPPSKATLLRGANRKIAVQGDTLWTLAWKAYRSILDRSNDQGVRPTGFWWIIGLANDIVDPFEEITEGTAIFIPTLEVIYGDVLVPPAFYRKDRVT
jgi:hypothetical protein